MTHPLVTAARRYLGVRWRHRGRNPAVGLDCAGLAVVAYHDCGIDVPDMRVYGREPYRDGLMDAVRRALGAELPGTEDVEVGDVIVVRFTRLPHHIAIVGDYVAGGLSMIHASGEVGRVIETRLDDDWRSRICAVFRRPING